LTYVVRTARTTVQNYNGTQYCSTDTILLIFTFLQINITSQMWPSGGKEVGNIGMDLKGHSRSGCWGSI